jgi:DnaJ-class molecular chaperone
MSDQNDQVNPQYRDGGGTTVTCHHCGGKGTIDFGPNRGETCCHCEGQGRSEESGGSASCCAGAFGGGYSG